MFQATTVSRSAGQPALRGRSDHRSRNSTAYEHKAFFVPHSEPYQTYTSL